MLSVSFLKSCTHCEKFLDLSLLASDLVILSPMAADNSPPRSPTSTSYFQKTVTLLDWWLTKPQTHHHTNTLGVAGLTSQQNRAARCFSSASILKVFDLFELETVDGVSVILQGYINKDRTLENGFPSEVFDHFIIGFPSNWKEYCPKIESAAKFVTTVQEEDGKDCIEGLDIHGKQNCDSNTVDMGVEDCKETVLSNKDSTPLNASLDEIPHEHIIEAGNEVLCERSHLTQAFKDDPSVETSPIVINTVVSSTRPKCLGVSNRRVTRSMKKMGISKNSCPLVNDKGALTDPGILGSSENLNNKAVNAVDYDMKSKSRNIDSELSGGCGKGSNETASCSKDTVIKVESKQKQIDQNVDAVIVKDTRNKDDADVSDESQIDTRITDLKEKHFTPKASDPLSKMSVGVTDVNDDGVLVRTNMKSCRNQRKNRVDVPQTEGAPATHGISSKEAVITRNRSKTKLPVKRKLITSPTSAKSTPLRGKKRTEARNGSANILSIESFSGKKSRSGRVVLPHLEFWRNQKVVYDEAGEMCGVEEPK